MEIATSDFSPLTPLLLRRLERLPAQAELGEGRRPTPFSTHSAERSDQIAD
jgi:hypothetical protein